VGTRQGLFLADFCKDQPKCRNICPRNSDFQVLPVRILKVKHTSIDSHHPTYFTNLQSESILLSSLQSNLGFNFFLLFIQNFHLTNVYEKCKTLLSSKKYFDNGKRSGSLEYLRDGFEIIPVSSSIQKLFKKQ